MKVIFSTFQDTAFMKQNYKSMRDLEAFLKLNNIPYTDCVGAYLGVKELSVMIDSKDLSLEFIRRYARAAKQKCILVVSDYGSAYLDFLDNDELEYIGTWTEVDSTENYSDYTKIGNKYFVVK